MIESAPVKMEMPPAIIKCSHGTYAVGGNWVKIPDNTTFETLHRYAVYEVIEPEKPTGKYLVKSANGSKKYTVQTWKNSKVTCDCSGFRWRNKCKHASAVQKAVINRPKGKG